MNDNFVANTKPSPNNTRDLIAETIYPTKDLLKLPKTLDLRKDLQPVISQGKQGSCAAQTGACIKEWQERKDAKLDEYMSAQFIYNSREDFPNGSGMYGRNVMEILQGKGCCREMVFPYDKSNENTPVSKEAIKDAENYKIKSYAQINTIDGVRIALYKNGPCYIAFPCYNHSPEFWKPTKKGDEIIGGHAVSIIGYNKDGFIIRNSWGSSWGNNGYTIYKYTDFGCHWEIWTTIDDNSPIPDSIDRTIGCFYSLMRVFR